MKLSSILKKLYSAYTIWQKKKKDKNSKNEERSRIGIFEAIPENNQEWLPARRKSHYIRVTKLLMKSSGI